MKKARTILILLVFCCLILSGCGTSTESEPSLTVYSLAVKMSSFLFLMV